MKALLWILILILIVVALGGGAWLIDRYGARSASLYDLAHKTTDSVDGLLNRINTPRSYALANEEGSRLCANIPKTIGTKPYNGKVYPFDVLRSAKFRFFSLVQQQDPNLYSTGDLHDGDAILCIRYLGISTRKTCQFEQPKASVEFLSAQAEFTLIAWPAGTLIGHEIVDSYDPQCPKRWADICEIIPCTELDPIFVDAWLKNYLVESPATSENALKGSICWTQPVTNFQGSRSQAWEAQLDAETKALLPYDQFIQQVVIYNPQLQTDGYIFLVDKTYMFPRVCQ
jgi:hypothetical protein